MFNERDLDKEKEKDKELKNDAANDVANDVANDTANDVDKDVENDIDKDVKKDKAENKDENKDKAENKAEDENKDENKDEDKDENKDEDKDENKDENKDEDKDEDEDENNIIKAEALHKTKAKNKLIGQGSYGCVYYPGITCDGKINKKIYVTKLQEINFYSANEIFIGKHIKKHIPKYKSMYAPIIKYCSVSFQTIQKSKLNIHECATLFPDSKDNYGQDYGQNYAQDYGQDYAQDYMKNSSYSSHLHTKYYLMYMNFIKNKTIKKFFKNYINYNTYTVDLIKIFNILIKSISILVSNTIIHNDFHVNNILMNLKNNKPIIIDFGLSMFYNDCFKYQNKTINFEYFKNLIFDFREDQYHVILEKRFLAFILYNKSNYYSINISNNYVKNELTKAIIDLFIKDAYESIANQDVIYFNKVELYEYYKALKQFYYQFLNKYKYPNYTTIIIYLIKFLFKYTDLHSLVFNIFYVHYSTKSNKFNSDNEIDTHTTTNSKPLFDFFLQLYKKTLNPNPLMRLEHSKLNKIYNYINKSRKNVSYDVFIKELTVFLVLHSINPKIMFDKKFAHLDFHLLINN